MPKVKFLPMDRECNAEVGESVLEVALANEINIMHACGGFCACSTCHIKVISGAEFTSPQEDEEKSTLEHADQRAENSRLGCQTKIKGDLIVEVVNQE